MKQIIFLSGIPRSGSQVLSSLLNQHQLIHSTTTNPLADLLILVKENWFDISGAIVNRDPTQYANILNGIIQGSHKHIDKPIILDKNRLWPRLINEVTLATKSRPKIICTVRDIPEILASYLLLLRKNNDNVNFIDKTLIEQKIPLTNKNRCKLLVENYINHPYTSLRIAYNSNNIDLLLVDYYEIVNDSQQTFNRICDFIGIDYCEVNVNNLQPMKENDNFHGALKGLHEVRPIMKKTSGKPEDILGHELTNYYRQMKLEFWKK